jgi:outer membrane lipoprotein-sorting protein
MVLAEPDVAFQGKVMIARWDGPRSRAEEATVYFRPPSSTRWEFLGPDGHLQRVVVSDGQKQRVRIAGRRKSLVGDAAKSRAKVMSADRERMLLISNYASTSLPPEKVAGRPAWLLQLKPVIDGKPEQRFWVDQETEVVLEVKRTLPGGEFAVDSVFTQFDPEPELKDALFETTPGAGGGQQDRVMAPAFMTLDELQRAGSFRVPAELPEGFSFESADAFDVAGGRVLHARYTDGLAVLSLFRTDRPVRLTPGGMVAEAAATDVPSFRLSARTRTLHWKQGSAYYTLVGDLSQQLLEKISKHFR